MSCDDDGALMPADGAKDPWGKLRHLTTRHCQSVTPPQMLRQIRFQMTNLLVQVSILANDALANNPFANDAVENDPIADNGDGDAAEDTRLPLILRP